MSTPKPLYTSITKYNYMTKQKKQKVDYRLWFIVLLGLVLLGPIGAVAVFIIYTLVDRHNKKKVIK